LSNSLQLTELLQLVLQLHHRLIPCNTIPRRVNERDTTKPGLWTLDWTVDWTLDWTVDWTLDSIMDSISGLKF